MTTSTPCARRSRIVSTTSSSVSPMPATIPDFVISVPALRPALRPHLLGPREQPQRAVVVALDAHRRLDAAAGLDVVVEDVGTGLEHRHQRLLLEAEEVGHQHLDVRLGAAAAQRADGLRPVAGAAIGQVVAVDRRDDDVPQAHPLGRGRHLGGLQRVELLAELARAHRAVAAGARARLAHDLERRRAAPPALADVRAARLLADRVQVALAHDVRRARRSATAVDGARTVIQGGRSFAIGLQGIRLRRSRSAGRRGPRGQRTASRRRLRRSRRGTARRAARARRAGSSKSSVSSVR